MENSVTILKRHLSSKDIDLIKELIEEHGHRGRTAISKQLCQIWDWRTANGQYRDILCRDLLRRLERRGLIELPPPLNTFRKPGYTNNIKKIDPYKGPPITRSLNDFTKIEFFMVRGRPEERLYNSLIHSFHYLGYHQGSGEQLKYIIRGDGEVLSCIGFAGAAYKVSVRDQYIGWDRKEREENLEMIVNNHRFLILPWIEVRNLASFILGTIARRIARDWQAYYSHEIVMLETFVESQRFRGSCYKAANWKYLGHTKGRGRNDRHSRKTLPYKDMYIYPLFKDFRERLIG